MAGQPNKRRGMLLSVAAIPAAMVLWVIVWSMGYIASIVAFALAYAVIWLYEKGAGAKPDKTVALPLVAIILVGSLLSFMAGMAADGWSYYHSAEYTAMAQPTDGEVIGYIVQDFSNSQIWGAYTNDIMMTVLFTLIGAGGVIYTLFKSKASRESVEKTSAK